MKTRTPKVVSLKVPLNMLLVWPLYSLRDPKPKGTVQGRTARPEVTKEFYDEVVCELASLYCRHQPRPKPSWWWWLQGLKGLDSD